MQNLTTILLPNQRNPALIADCSALVRQIVAEKRGVRGQVIKAVFAAITRQRPDVLSQAFTRLLPLFCQALEPLFVEWQKTNVGEFSDFLRARPALTTQTLLQVTDNRAQRARPMLQKTYQRLRPHAEREVAAALPKILALLEPYLTTPAKRTAP